MADQPTDLQLYECGLTLELSGYPRLGSVMVTAARLPDHEQRRDWLCLARSMARKQKLLA